METDKPIMSSVSAARVKLVVKSKNSSRRKAKVQDDSWKHKSLIRPWARESALSVFQAFSTEVLTEIPEIHTGR